MDIMDMAAVTETDGGAEEQNRRELLPYGTIIFSIEKEFFFEQLFTYFFCAVL